MDKGAMGVQLKWEKSTEGREGKGERAAGCGGGGLRVKGWQWERGVLRRGEDGGGMPEKCWSFQLF